MSRRARAEFYCIADRAADTEALFDFGFELLTGYKVPTHRPLQGTEIPAAERVAAKLTGVQIVDVEAADPEGRWCKCEQKVSAGYRREGWIVCLLCKKDVGGMV